MIQVKAFEYVVKNGLLKHNVKFIFEGEEEIGSPSLNTFIKEHKELLKADVILVSDTSMLGVDLPSLTTGLRLSLIHILKPKWACMMKTSLRKKF